MVERHLRRFFYRSDPAEKMRTFAIDCNNYGDGCASLGLELGKEKTAELGKSLDPQAAEQLVKDSFVDDVAAGGSREDVLRMRGSRDSLGDYSGTVPKILAAGGFKAKALVMSGECTQEEADTIGGKFLGVGYCPFTDKILVNFTKVIRLDSRKTSRPKTVDLTDMTPEDIDLLLNTSAPLTKRKVVGFMMAQFDLLGLAAPVLLVGKLKLRQLYGKEFKLGWDDTLPEAMAKQWLQYIQALVHTEPICFPRPIKTEDCKELWLIGFWDGSTMAHGAVIYARTYNISAWDESTIDSNLLIAKTRVSPIAGSTIPRMELQGLLQLSRLMLKVVESLQTKVHRIVLAGDSACSIMALKRDGLSFNAYFQHRLAEIQQNLNIMKNKVDKLEPILKIDGSLNPADICTRDTGKISDLLPGSTWQKGPQFLQKPLEDWPLKNIENNQAIPAEEMKRVNTVQHIENYFGPSDPSLTEWIQQTCQRSLNLKIIKSVLIRCLKARGQPNYAAVLRENPNAIEMEIAHKLILMAHMEPTAQAWKKGKLSSLNPVCKKGIIYTQGRYSDAKMLEITGQVKLPILLASTRAALLIAWDAHLSDHAKDINGLLARMRRSAWIVKGRGLARQIIKSCVKCRLQSQKLATQIMGELPDYTLDKADPFTAVAVDLFGPLWAKGVGGHGRKLFKVWGTLFVCLATKAVSIWAALSYSTKDFLLCFTKHVNIYGYPKIVISDHGSQLVAAAEHINWGEVQHSTANKGTVWEFTPKGCPWRNGMAERSIGIAKNLLLQVINKHQTLNVVEVETAFIQVASLMNQRPITARVYNEEEFCPISPSDLLLGRAAGLESRLKMVWENPEHDLTDINVKHQEIQKIVDTWWETWQRDAFPLFCPRKKWTTQNRNLAPGDIVLLKYDKALGKSKYRIAKVVKIHPDPHNNVRTVTIALRDRTKARKELPEIANAPQTEMIVGVQRLVVLLPVEEIWEQGLVKSSTN